VRTFWIFLAVASSVVAQNIEQATKGACSPAVVSSGTVTITCTSANEEDVKKIQKGIEVLNAVLSARDDQIIVKLDAIEALLGPLHEQLGRQDQQISAIQKFTESSKLNTIGLTGRVLPPLTEQTPISEILKGTYTIAENSATFSCDSESLPKYRQVVASFPTFPFSHSILAQCLAQKGDPEWRVEATAAVAILRNTVTIDGHHPSHDLVLQQMEAALKAYK
jgi:hypothetical protein